MAQSKDALDHLQEQMDAEDAEEARQDWHLAVTVTATLIAPLMAPEKVTKEGFQRVANEIYSAIRQGPPVDSNG